MLDNDYVLGVCIKIAKKQTKERGNVFHGVFLFASAIYESIIVKQAGMVKNCGCLTFLLV